MNIEIHSLDTNQLTYLRAKLITMAGDLDKKIKTRTRRLNRRLDRRLLESKQRNGLEQHLDDVQTIYDVLQANELTPALKIQERVLSKAKRALEDFLYRSKGIEPDHAFLEQLQIDEMQTHRGRLLVESKSIEDLLQQKKKSNALKVQVKEEVFAGEKSTNDKLVEPVSRDEEGLVLNLPLMDRTTQRQPEFKNALSFHLTSNGDRLLESNSKRSMENGLRIDLVDSKSP